MSFTYPCPACGERNVRCIDSRQTHKIGVPAVIRRRVCRSCGERHTTYEVAATVFEPPPSMEVFHATVPFQIGATRTSAHSAEEQS